MLSADALRVASHEAAHAAIAHLLGLRVEYVSRNRLNGGATMTVYEMNDPRDVSTKAFDRALVALGAVLVEDLGSGRCDEDVARAREYLRLADATFEAASERARGLIASRPFRQLHRGVQFALFDRPHLDADDLRPILADVPPHARGVTPANPRDVGEPFRAGRVERPSSFGRSPVPDRSSLRTAVVLRPGTTTDGSR
ncbi:MAG: hypothetical protein WD556_09515 [Actinomycetota bacterium]